jgi:hypothetical protein
VGDLTTALNHPESRAKAAGVLRGLILEIRLTPSDDGHKSDLILELAAIMVLDDLPEDWPLTTE